MYQMEEGNKQRPKAVIKTVYTLVNKKKMKDRTFTYAKIVKLIDLYQQNNCLWNISSPDFRCQEKRQAVLSQIAKVFNITPAEVKRKIRSLRATYLLERRKVLASEKKVKDGLESCVYEPILVWYKYMSFLDDIIVFRTPTMADSVAQLSAKLDFRSQIKDTQDAGETHLEKVEAIYYENDDKRFKCEDVTIPAEYLEAKYICEETLDQEESIDVSTDEPHYFMENDQHSSGKGNEGNLENNSEELTSLQADRIRAETEYFRKKAEYVDICIDKERKLKPLLIAKLKLEIENLTKGSSRNKNGIRNKRFAI